jgi:hypothetical protein
VVVGFGFCGRDGPDWFEQTAVVEPVDPFEGRVCDDLDAWPRASAMDDLGFVDPVIQGLRFAADLQADRQDRLPARSMLALIIQNQPHRAFAHFTTKLARCLAHDTPYYSEVGASGKPRVVQRAKEASLQIMPVNFSELSLLRRGGLGNISEKLLALAGWIKKSSIAILQAD